MERYSWKDCERQEKIDELKKKAKDKAVKFKNSTVDFWNKNKEAIIVVIPLVLAGLSETRKIVTRHDKKVEDARRECRVYDPSMGDWWELKKPLTNAERLEMERRVANGELRGDVLNDMGKLRK